MIFMVSMNGLRCLKRSEQANKEADNNWRFWPFCCKRKGKATVLLYNSKMYFLFVYDSFDPQKSLPVLSESNEAVIGDI